MLKFEQLTEKKNVFLWNIKHSKFDHDHFCPTDFHGWICELDIIETLEYLKIADEGQEAKSYPESKNFILRQKETIHRFSPLRKITKSRS
jgi:hypothetical protein